MGDDGRRTRERGRAGRAGDGGDPVRRARGQGLKNYIATEFLYDYLKDKKSVGVIDEDRERALQYVAEPIGVVLALLPITNPTSTTLFKSIVCGQDAQRADHATVGSRRSLLRAAPRSYSRRRARRLDCRPTHCR